jgi:peptidyl-prolyl cis-trans isomerase SurA
VIILPSVSAADVLLDRVVAVVNQEVITWSELYRAMEADASPQLKELKDDDRRRVFKENEAQFLENLINVKLQLQEAKTLGITAGDEEVKEAVDGIMKKYSMNEEAFKDSLKKEGYTFEEYRKRLREQIIISKVVNQQIRNKILVSDDNVRKFMAENKDVAENAEGYRISQIFFKKSGGESEKKNTEEKAAAVIRELNGGAAFGDLAKKYSEDASGSTGGSLGFVKKNQLLKEFSDALALMKPGDVSAPFWTDKGLHIIKLDEKTAVKGQDEIMDDAKKSAGNKLFIDRYNAWLKGLRERAFIEVRL